jgi:hypothetical protein
MPLTRRHRVSHTTCSCKKKDENGGTSAVDTSNDLRHPLNRWTLHSPACVIRNNKDTLFRDTWHSGTVLWRFPGAVVLGDGLPEENKWTRLLRGTWGMFLSSCAAA